MQDKLLMYVVCLSAATSVFYIRPGSQSTIRAEMGTKRSGLINPRTEEPRSKGNAGSSRP